MTRTILALAALLFATPALAQSTPANPTPDPRCGTTIVLTGDLGALWRPWAQCPDAKRVTYDTTRASWRSAYIAGQRGLNIRGGRVYGGGQIGMQIVGSRDFTIEGVAVTNVGFGFTVAASSDFELVHNTCEGIGSDCFNTSSIQRARIAGNYFLAATITAGSHPDTWQDTINRGGNPPTADVVFEGNTARGDTQGAYLEGNAERVTIRGNLFDLGVYNAVLLNNAKRASVTGNAVKAWGKVLPWIKATGTDNTVCGNTGPAVYGAQGLGAC